MIVLDASALLAYLHKEPGWERVQLALHDACIGAVNWSEVAQKIAMKRMDVGTVRLLLEELGLCIVNFSAEEAEIAARLWEKNRQHGLSLADRACLALATRLGIPVLTADRVWSELETDMVIQVIR